MDNLKEKNWLDVKSLNTEEIMYVLPHRYPFLMVDKVTEIFLPKPLKIGMSEEEVSEIRKEAYVKTLKNITFNEPQFQGHFPDMPIFPGVLTLEAMAQSAAFLIIPFVALKNGGKISKFNTTLVGFDEVRYRRPIRPGDVMNIKVNVTNCKKNIWRFKAEVTVDDKPAAEGTFMAQLT